MQPATSITAFVGRTARGSAAPYVTVTAFSEFERCFGGPDLGFSLAHAVRNFFDNGGTTALIVPLVSVGNARGRPLSARTYLGSRRAKSGLYALERAAEFNILCIPPDTLDGDTPPAVYRAAAEYCVERRAMLILDPPRVWQEKYARGDLAGIALSDLGSFSAEARRSAAVYFPRIIVADSAQAGAQHILPASGAIAGLWAATDASRGVWKAPAGSAATLKGATGLEAALADADIEFLGRQGINSLRRIGDAGLAVWGSRTLAGDGTAADEYRYIPVRRTRYFIERSVLQSIEFAVFEPNGQALWGRIRSTVEPILHDLFKAGAFPASRPQDAYFVKCDASTTTQADIDAGFVNIAIGFAPLRPAEFVVIAIRQRAARRA